MYMKHRIRTIILSIFLVLFISYLLILPVAEMLRDRDTGICYYDYKFETAQTIGNDSVAPPGSQYLIATIYLKNDAKWREVDTFPDEWYFYSDNRSYNCDSATYEDAVDEPNTYIVGGQEVEIQIVYLVPGTVNTGYVGYSGPSQPEFKRIQYY